MSESLETIYGKIKPTWNMLMSNYANSNPCWWNPNGTGEYHVWSPSPSSNFKVTWQPLHFSTLTSLEEEKIHKVNMKKKYLIRLK